LRVFTEEEWEEKYDIVKMLWPGMTRRKMQVIMEEEYGFRARYVIESFLSCTNNRCSEDQWKKHLNKWRIQGRLPDKKRRGQGLEAQQALESEHPGTAGALGLALESDQPPFVGLLAGLWDAYFEIPFRDDAEIVVSDAVRAMIQFLIDKTVNELPPPKFDLSPRKEDLLLYRRLSLETESVSPLSGKISSIY
jgi:Clr5 domain